MRGDGDRAEVAAGLGGDDLEGVRGGAGAVEQWDGGGGGQRVGGRPGDGRAEQLDRRATRGDDRGDDGSVGGGDGGEDREQRGDERGLTGGEVLRGGRSAVHSLRRWTWSTEVGGAVDDVVRDARGGQPRAKHARSGSGGDRPGGRRCRWGSRRGRRSGPARSVRRTRSTSTASSGTDFRWSRGSVGASSSSRMSQAARSGATTVVSAAVRSSSRRVGSEPRLVPSAAMARS